jgi:hypothetical protein
VAAKFHVGDLVLANKKHGYDSLHFEWCTGLNHPVEYAIITEIVELTSSYHKFYVKFIDGSEDCIARDEMRLVCEDEKFPASAAPEGINED